MFVALAAILYAISVAMMAYGGWTAIDGAQWFPAERAVAQYISGVGLATGGCVLFGIATLVFCLGKLNETLKKSQGNLPAQPSFAPVEAPPFVAPVVAAASSAPFTRDVAIPPQVSAEGEAMASSPQTDFVAVEPLVSAPDLDIAAQQSVDHALSDFSRSLRMEDEAPAKSNENAFAYDYSSPVELPPSLTPQYYEKAESISSDTAVDLDVLTHDPVYEEPVVVAAEEAAPVIEDAPKPDPTVVGSYESGGNRYVMYSDGSIEAHLPSGVRVFHSLDELKQFVSSASAN